MQKDEVWNGMRADRKAANQNDLLATGLGFALDELVFDMLKHFF